MFWVYNILLTEMVQTENKVSCEEIIVWKEKKKRERKKEIRKETREKKYGRKKGKKMCDSVEKKIKMN